MQKLWVSTRWLLLFVSICFFSIGQSCDCDTSTGKADWPMKIDFLEPAGVQIVQGLVKVKVEDLDLISEITFFIDGKNVGKKTFNLDNGQTKVTLERTFDLKAQPENFVIRVEGKDANGNAAKKELAVRKKAGFPFILFTAPNKLDPKHNKIYVGKKFSAGAEAKDDDGIAWVLLKAAPQGAKPVDLGRCTPKQKSTKFNCKAEVDASAYKEGPLVLLASAQDNDGKKPAKDARREVWLDKTGPQIRIVSPKLNERLTSDPNKQYKFVAQVADQVGVKSVQFFMGGKELTGTAVDPSNPQIYNRTGPVSGSGTAVPVKVIATDNLGNVSEVSTTVRMGCESDADCSHKPGTRCCLGVSDNNKDGSKTGSCQPIQNAENGRCDPCTNPCGKGSDGKLMGCLKGACDTGVYRCRRACDLGNRNRAADACGTGEYCAVSDLTKINPQFGACAKGSPCDIFTQQGCPAGYGCFPADTDANICVPEGTKARSDTKCVHLGGQRKDCKSVNNCKKGLICAVTVDSNNRPVGDSSCRSMCRPTKGPTGYTAKLNAPECSGYPCVPLRMSNGSVPLPVGSCLTCLPRGASGCSASKKCCPGARCTIGLCF